MADSAKCIKKYKNLPEYGGDYRIRSFKYLRLLVHSIGAAQFLYGTFYWRDTSSRTFWGGKFQYLTFLNVALQGTYHVVALLNDFFGSNDLDPQPAPLLRKVRDFIFTTIGFPTAQNVSLTFWTIYTYNRQLVFPRSLDAVYPAWLNHIIHSNVAIFSFLDMLTCCRRYPEKEFGILITSTTMLLYVSWLHITRYFNGRWTYPLLNVLNAPMRYIMFSIIIGLNIVGYTFGDYLNSIVWAPELNE